MTELSEDITDYQTCATATDEDSLTAAITTLTNRKEHGGQKVRGALHLPAYTPTPAKPGSVYLSGGVQIVFKSVKTTTTNGSKSAGAGAEYVSINVKVKDNTKVGLDLTCGYPIDNHLYNQAGQQFDAIESLYEIDGNPECNNDLQPGFSEGMSYVYRVPVAAKLEEWDFADADDALTTGGGSQAGTTYINL